jgi:hypothetical protein
MKTKYNVKGGYALVFVMAFLLILSAAGVGILAKARLLRTAGIRWERATQLGWEAQAGIEEAVAYLMDKDNEEGTFDSAFGKAEVTIEELATDVYRASSVAQEGKMIVAVEQILQRERAPTTNGISFFPQFYIMGGGSGLAMLFSKNLNLSGEVAGTMLFVDGSMYFGGPVSTNDISVFYTGTNNIAMGTWTNSLPDGAAEVIQAIYDKMAGYETLIDAGGPKTNFVSGKMALNGQTVILSGTALGDYTLNQSVSISGTGTVIVQGNLTVAQNKLMTLASGIDLLVGGNINAGNGFKIIGTNNVIYAGGTLTTQNNVDFSSNGGSILINGNATVNFNNAVLNSFIFIDGKVVFKNNLTMDGILVAQQIEAQNNATVNLDPSKIPDWLALLMQETVEESVVAGQGDVLRILRMEWNEAMKGGD